MNVRCDFFLVFLSFAIAPPAFAQRVLFVDAAAGGIADGRSWADAFTSLQDALAVAEAGDEIWVAAGVYRPDQGRDVVPGDRTASFHLKDGVALYGGFAGTETRREERDGETNETMLSGDLLGNDNDNVALGEPTRSDNSLHVVTAKHVGDRTMLEGVTVTSGNADNGLGGGMVAESASLVIRQVIFADNTAINGGGLFTQLEGRPILETVLFLNNEAGGITGNGGGLLNYGSSPSLRDVTFKNNRAKDGGGLFNDSDNTTLGRVLIVGNRAVDGGGLYNMSADIRISNAVFLGNAALNGGGAMLNEKSSPLLTNVVFSGNQTANDLSGGGAILNYESSPVLMNTVFSLNHAVGKGGALWNEYKSYPTLINSILWGNTAGEGAQVYNRSGACCPDGPSWVIASHSLIEGGLPEGTEDGGDNRFVDPLFVDPDGPDDIPGTLDDDLRLEWTSPAIDAGDNAALPPDVFDLDDDGDRREPLPVDLDGNLRVHDGGSGTATVDMGAYEFDAPPVGVAVEDRDLPQPAEPVRVEAFPNPFRDWTTLHMSPVQPTVATVTLYDLLGRRLGVVYEGPLGGAAGTTLPVDARHLPAGLYVVRLTGPGLHAVHRLVKVR